MQIKYGGFYKFGVLLVGVLVSRALYYFGFVFGPFFVETAILTIFLAWGMA